MLHNDGARWLLVLVEEVSFFSPDLPGLLVSFEMNFAQWSSFVRSLVLGFKIRSWSLSSIGDQLVADPSVLVP